MPKPRVAAAGGLAAIAYSVRKGREAGGLLALYRRMRSRNACKTCALGMGGQHGGMVNESGSFPEVCKKSLQAQAGDMQAPLTDAFFAAHSVKELEDWSSRRLEAAGRLAFPIAWRTGDTHFSRIEWDEALDRTARSLLESAPNETFFYSSGRSSNEAAFSPAGARAIVWDRQHPQLLVLLPSGIGRGAKSAPRYRHVDAGARRF